MNGGYQRNNFLQKSGIINDFIRFYIIIYGISMTNHGVELMVFVIQDKLSVFLNHSGGDSRIPEFQILGEESH